MRVSAARPMLDAGVAALHVPAGLKLRLLQRIGLQLYIQTVFVTASRHWNEKQYLVGRARPRICNLDNRDNRHYQAAKVHYHYQVDSMGLHVSLLTA